jgi:hypothetical protein
MDREVKRSVVTEVLGEWQREQRVSRWSTGGFEGSESYSA